MAGATLSPDIRTKRVEMRVSAVSIAHRRYSATAASLRSVTSSMIPPMRYTAPRSFRIGKRCPRIQRRAPSGCRMRNSSSRGRPSLAARSTRTRAGRSSGWIALRQPWGSCAAAEAGTPQIRSKAGLR